MADVNFAKAAKVLEDPAFLAIGFGVLGFQRAQVFRHAVQRQAKYLYGDLAPWRQMVGEAATGVVSMLPPEAAELARATGSLMASLPGEARELAKEAVAVGRFAFQAVRAPVVKRATYP
ncbi:MAG: hypothetical protein ACLQVK_14505 [Acidimicrobiales bacterium]|jgi:hypothetical protein